MLSKNINRKWPLSRTFKHTVGEVLRRQSHSLFFFFCFHAFCDRQKPQIAYKVLMKGYHNKVNTLAGHKNKTEVTLVINLFQSVLDGFIRGELKRMEAEPAKVSMKALVCIDLSLSNLTFWMCSGYQDNEEEEEKRQMRKLDVRSFYFEDFPFLHPCELSALFSPQPDSPLDHRFSTYQVNVMQSCDLCGSYIWGMERAYMCSGECKKE